MKNTDFAVHLGKYFTRYLPSERGSSPQTIDSYRYAFILFLEYMETKGVPAEKMTITDFTRDTTYTFTKATDTTIDLTIPAMDDMGHMSIPALTVKGISLTTDGKTINGTLDSYAGKAIVSDSIEKAFTVTNLVVVFSDKAAALKYGNMPFPFAGQFTGVKK